MTAARGAPLTRRRDPRGVEYVETTVRVTGPASIDALELLAAQNWTTPTAVATRLVGEELWWLTAPGMRDRVRRSRADRRRRFDLMMGGPR